MTKIFITGATGFLGRNYLDKLVNETNDEFYILIRSDKSKNLIKNRYKNHSQERFHFIRGNIAQENFGLTIDDFMELKKCTKIYHFAASTSFDDRNREEIIRININGVKNLIKVAEKIPNLENLNYISTSYISGLNQGTIYEDEMPQNVGFKNAYEESKYLSELLIRDSALPWTIFRPSIIVGDSKTYDNQGETRMVYGYLLGVYYSILKGYTKEEFHSNWQKRIKMPIHIRVIGCNNAFKNFVCIDDVVEMIYDITQNNDTDHKTYHLTNDSYPLQKQVISWIGNALHINGLKLSENISAPSAVEKRAMLMTKPFNPYALNSDPVWDTTNVDNALTNHKKINMTQSLFTNLMEHFVENNIIHVQRSKCNV